MTDQNNTIQRTSQEDEFGLPVTRIIAQVQRIQEVMRAVMKENEHYGKIPGCGDKPALLKPGAEKLCLAFRLAPKYEIAEIEMGGGHVRYEVTCRLYTIDSERLVGEGVGSCSTMEGKFRFRSENTGKEVPKQYWENRDSRLLGGHDYSARKNDGKWVIVHRVEHDNPADYYNTCKKMAAKRAQVAATLTATAASDIFTQDIEEDLEGGVGTEPPKQTPTIRPPQPRAQNGNGKSTPPPADAQLQHIDLVEVKEGMKNGKPWKKYSVKIGRDFYSTFSETDGNNAVKAWQQGWPIILEFKQEGDFKNITKLQVIEKQPEPELQGEETPAF